MQAVCIGSSESVWMCVIAGFRGSGIEFYASESLPLVE